MQKKTWSVVIKGLAGVAAIFVVALVAGISIAHLSRQGTVDGDMAVLVIVGLVAVLIMALSLWMGIAWMRSIDEAAQEAHKAAWFYGGSAGMAVGGLGVIWASLPQAAEFPVHVYLPGRTDPAAYAASGAITMLGLMMVGYTVVWLWWWWRRR